MVRTLSIAVESFVREQTSKNLVEMQLHHSYFHTFWHTRRAFSVASLALSLPPRSLFRSTGYLPWKTCALTTLNAPLNKFNGERCFEFSMYCEVRVLVDYSFPMYNSEIETFVIYTTTRTTPPPPTSLPSTANNDSPFIARFQCSHTIAGCRSFFSIHLSIHCADDLDFACAQQKC